MTDTEKLDWTIRNWNIATDEQKAEASIIAKVAAADRITEIEVNRAMGFIFDYRTGKFVDIK